MTEKEARTLRSLITQGAQSLTDAQVSTAPEVLPRPKYDGSLISNGTRINWNGTIKRAAVDLWDTEANDPDHAPTLWEDVLYRDGSPCAGLKVGGKLLSKPPLRKVTPAPKSSFMPLPGLPQG